MANGDGGARASSIKSARAMAATCWRGFERVPWECVAEMRGAGGGALRSLFGCTVLAGRDGEEAWLWRRMRRRFLPGAPVLLWKVSPTSGVGRGPNEMVFGALGGEGTLRGGCVMGGGAI